MGNISVAYNWLINACNAPNIGYSMQYRKGQTVGGITYYDCSSIISKALTIGGFFETNPWFSTSSMPTVLQNAGFTMYDAITTPWVIGDIVWRPASSGKYGHTEMVYLTTQDGYFTMGAHSASYPLDRQVSINNNPTAPASYTKIFRYTTTPITLDWIKGNYYLSITEMKNNAYIIYSYLTPKGWSLNAICGMLGNLQRESTINPAIWQGLSQSVNLGYGLAQWTPSTKYTNWANSKGYAIDDGYKQLEWLDEEMTPSGEWIPTTDYPISYEEYKHSNESLTYTTTAFLLNFERAGISALEERISNANYWYNYLRDLPPTPPHPSTPRKGMPLWFYLL